MSGGAFKSPIQAGIRAGTQALTLLSAPINARVLEVLAEGPCCLIDLRRAAGSPPANTMRGHLRALTQTGVVKRLVREDFPGTVDFEITPSGRELDAVAEVLRSWLEDSPEGPVRLTDTAAKSAIKAFVDGWGTGMVRAIAGRPISLTELDGVISGISYPSLERRLSAMRLAGLVEKAAGQGRGTPYVATARLRSAIGPLLAAARWERLNATAETKPIARLDAEAAFLLAVPLLDLPADLSGACRLAVSFPAELGERLGGVMVAVNDGVLCSCVTDLQGRADAWASGSAGDWLATLAVGETECLEIGGDSRLANALVDGLRAALFSRRLTTASAATPALP